MEQAFFLLFAGAMVLFTLLTMFVKNPVHSAIFMILSFAATAGLFVLLDAYLMAAIEVLVYAGAIMVLFLFVIMLINLRAAEQERLKLSPLGILAALTFLVLFGRAVGDVGPAVGAKPNDLEGNPDVLAQLLFTEYAVPFEALSALLTVAVIGCVVLSRKRIKA